LLQLAATTPLARIDTLLIRRWLAQLHGGGLGGSLGRCLGLAWLFAWLSPSDWMPIPVKGYGHKSPKRLPKALARTRLLRLMAIPWATRRVRRKATKSCSLATGRCSSSSILGLRLVELVQLDCGEVTACCTKAKRVVGKWPAPPDPGRPGCTRRSFTWLPLRDTLAADDEILFVGRRGRRLSPRAIQLRLTLGRRCKFSAARPSAHAACHSSLRTCNPGDLRGAGNAARQHRFDPGTISISSICPHDDATLCAAQG
jgi:integrase/recombinase XerC